MLRAATFCPCTYSRSPRLILSPWNSYTLHSHKPYRVCRTLVLTDHNAEVVERLSVNVQLNRQSTLSQCESVSVQPLDWSDFVTSPQPSQHNSTDARHTRTHNHAHSESRQSEAHYQVLLGADVVYSAQVRGSSRWDESKCREQ